MLQIVIKQGFVEIPMTGKYSDFNEAVMVRRQDVEDINIVIKVKFNFLL